MDLYLAAVLLGLSSTAYAQTAQKCASSNVCYSLNIPHSTASSGNGDIFFQIKAPTSMSWVALGQGSSMSGSNIFVLYTSSSGTNVTVSPRLGKSHSEPKFNSAAQITLLDGSGVSDGIMTANVRCSNCQSWSGGDMDFTASSASWIWAAKSGSALNSDDQSESISQHGNQGSFSFDFTNAKGGSSLNPFAASSNSGSTAAASGSAATAAATRSCTPKSRSPSQTSAGAASTTGTGSYNGPYGGPRGWQTDWPSVVPSEWSTYWSGGRPTNAPTSWPSGRPWAKRDDDDNDDDSCDDGSYGSSSGSSSGSSGGSSGNSNAGAFGGNGSFLGDSGGFFTRSRKLLIAHGVLACLAFAILFPAGAISIRVLSFPGLIWVHAGIQVFSYLVFIVAFGIGIYLATNFRMLNEYHPIIGIVLFVLLAFQPILGILHHALFKKYKRRTFWSYAHLWLGRIIITLGIINGGLGFLLADNTRIGPIVYGVVAGIVWLAYVAAAFYGERKRKQRLSQPPKYTERVESSNEGSPVRPEYYGKRT